MTSFAVSSGKRLPFHSSTCFLIGSKFRCMRSTPTERMSTRLRCFVCLASTGVNAPGTMLPSWNKSAGPSKRAATARLADCASAGVAGRGLPCLQLRSECCVASSSPSWLNHCLLSSGIFQQAFNGAKSPLLRLRSRRLDGTLQSLELLHFALSLRGLTLLAIERGQSEMRLRRERGFLLEFDHSGPCFFGRSRVAVE